MVADPREMQEKQGFSENRIDKFEFYEEVIIMRVETLETERLYLRGFQKEDAIFAISIWNDPEIGEYLPDEAMDEIDGAYLKE